MKKYIPIYIYGAIIIVSGIFLIFSQGNSLHSIKLQLGITLIIGALIAFIAAFSRLRKQVQFAYHEMHALGMFFYGLLILFFSDSIERFTTFSTFLFVFYTFSEMLFSNWLFNLKQNVIYKYLIIRLILALVVGVGALIAMNFTSFTLEIFGVLFFIIGLNIVLYVPIMKGKE
jgi:hypothetical protein